MINNLFMDKSISPMLISERKEPFNDPNWIYELKLDGCRCIAYIERGRVVLRNKRNMDLLPRFMELQNIDRQISDKCVLDGELVVMYKNKPDFYRLQRRTILTDRLQMELEINRFPATFIAYDCLQVGNKSLLQSPLMERKDILQSLISENKQFSYTRYVKEQGIQLYKLTEEQELEGVVAKRADSLYYPGKRSKEWIKFKRLTDKEFVICGYKPGKPTSLILGEFRNGKLMYAGVVSFGVQREILRILNKDCCPFKEDIPGSSRIIWCKPEHICVVNYMPNTRDSLRQPVFKGIRNDYTL